MVLKLVGSVVKLFKNQKYEDLRKEAQATGVPYSDPEFPADNTSLSYSGNVGQLPGRVVWKRPQELCDKPLLFVDGACACDVVQGVLGNCWFVAACSSLAQEKELWNKVIPDYKDQEWKEDDPESYCGIFRFRFWRFGEWIEVIVDDRLPTIGGELVYVRSREKNEFWGSLLEKAYAKLAGSYEALEGGNLSDALVDFTSGIAETLSLCTGNYMADEMKRKQLFKSMVTNMEQRSLMCCAIAAASRDELEQRTDFGLIKGHAYGITAVRKVAIGSTGLISFFKGREKVYMVRLRNPWGGKEWTGAFSDSSQEWAKISEGERDRIGLTFQEDGEFWMTFDDFCVNFTDLSICHLVNTSWFSINRSWSESSFKGQWTLGEKGTKSDRAGGCINHRMSFLRNPQYRFDIVVEEDTVMIYLMQEDTRSQRKHGADNLVIGFHILKVEENRRYRLHTMKETAASSDYIRTRGVFLRCTLKKGRYVVLPTTFEPEHSGSFLLRIFSGKNADTKELVKDIPSKSVCLCRGYPTLITMVTVRGASGLEKQDRFASADPYFIIKCGRETIRSHICRNTQDPIWNVSAIFYRTSINIPITIYVWNSNIVMDSFMGKAAIVATPTTEPVIHEAELFGRKKNSTEKRPGKLIVEIFTSDDLMSF